MRSRLKIRASHFVLVSLLLHAFSFLSLFLSSLLQEKPLPQQIVQMEIISPSDVSDSPAKTARKIVPERRNQIVDQADNALNDETPEAARFLGKNNQVVRKQTVAKNHGEFQNKQSKDTVKGQNGKQKAPSEIDLKPRYDVAQAIKDRIAREEQFAEAAKDGFLPPKNSATARNEGQEGKPASKGGEVSQTLDYIKDLDPGLETLLSTKEFVYYSYFNRIRTQLNQYWTDKVRQKLSEMYKRGRMIASNDDKVTKCLITLDTSGRLLRVQIIGDSGVHELDEAAIEAFKAAAPFPNPPKGMVDPDGTIKIRWDFILEA